MQYRLFVAMKGNFLWSIFFSHCHSEGPPGFAVANCHSEGPQQKTTIQPTVYLRQLFNSKPPTNQSNRTRTTQTTHKPPTNQPNHSKTSQILDNPPTDTNQLKITFFFACFLKTFIMISYKFRTQQLRKLLPHNIRPFFSSHTRRGEKKNR